jgi:hypothetical protein
MEEGEIWKRKKGTSFMSSRDNSEMGASFMSSRDNSEMEEKGTNEERVLCHPGTNKEKGASLLSSRDRRNGNEFMVFSRPCQMHRIVTETNCDPIETQESQEQ